MLFHLLGPVEARTSDGELIGLPAGKPTAVLATLLLNANRWVRVEQLISATWPEQDAPSSAVANLKTYVWQLRKALPEAVDGPRIASRPSAYRIQVDPGELDVDRAEGLATDARLALADGHLPKASELFAEALDLWRGEPCDGAQLAVSDGTLSWLAELRRELQGGLAETHVRLGRTREAIALLRSLTDEDPFREGAWAQWMLALSDAGRHGAALAVYDRVRAILADELGAEPGRELRDALAAVHRYQRARRPSRRRDLVRDVPDFTGRTTEIARLSALAGTGGVPVAVIDGMPGVGKTALAVHVAHRLAPSFPDAQLHVDLGETRPPEILDHLLRAIGVADEDIPVDEPGRAALWRAELAQRRVLVLLDDAKRTEQVLPLLPGSPGSLVLVTTRTRTLRPGGVCTITLDPLPPAAATELFRAVAADSRATGDPAAVEEVAQLCGGLPAALRAAADSLRSRPVWTLRQLADRLAVPRPVELSPVTDLITSAIRSLPEEPRRVLETLATMPGSTDVTTGPVRRALEELLDHHLAEQPGPGHYRLHPLVRDAMTPEPLRKTASGVRPVARSRQDSGTRTTSFPGAAEGWPSRRCPHSA
jgi:DNA-binding SARP family transcriptional activator